MQSKQFKSLRRLKKTVSEEMFDQFGAQTWTTRLSDGEEISLVKDWHYQNSNI